MLTWEGCEALMSRRGWGKYKKLTHNTYLSFRGPSMAHPLGSFVVELHGNDILQVLQDERWVVNTCRVRSMTTKGRVNDFSPMNVRQRNGEWFFTVDGQSFLFEDGLLVGANGAPVEAMVRERLALEAACWLGRAKEQRMARLVYLDWCEEHGLEKKWDFQRPGG